MEKSDVIAAVCAALRAGRRDEAAETAKRDYPFAAPARAGRKYTDVESTRVFLRDGFVDRYSGQRLVFPGVLRLLSNQLPEAFPRHPNWKMDETHFMFWELFPTIDHIQPVARGGADAEPNWVTTSMLRNATKAHWTLEELGWTLRPPGAIAEWDGLVGWFVEHVAADASALSDSYVRRWHRAATLARSG